MTKKWLLYTLLIGLIGFSSCTTDCFVPTESKLGVAFLSKDMLKPYTVTFSSVEVVGSDSILYQNNSLTAVYLPLSGNKQEQEYIFSMPATAEGEDAPEPLSLKVYYRSFPQLVSPECGCVLYHYIDSVSFTQGGDSVNYEIYKNEILNVEKDVHIKVYF